MLTNLKRSTLHLLLMALLAIVHVNCSRKQTATATSSSTSTTPSTSTATTGSQTSSTAYLQNYAGRYTIQSDDISWAEVTVENNKLYGESNGRPKTELVKESGDRFKVQGMDDAAITFTRNSQQQVNGMVISYQGNEIKGEKVK